ncbi:hypothetical protein [Streptomyces sp. NBC_00470]|uniref:hypothetical protein n=1 Tax=Streptomyces sp. NBC_00470 TaxID=2975753 RepID=UPI0030E3710F
MSLDLYPQPVENDRECLTLAEDETYYYDAINMLFNWRLVMTPKATPEMWLYGWCYDGQLALTLALKTWDPETQNEPLGWKKRPTRVVRVAPHPETDTGYNRFRCIHGHYPADGPCPDPHCPDRGRPEALR